MQRTSYLESHDDSERNCAKSGRCAGNTHGKNLSEEPGGTWLVEVRITRFHVTTDSFRPDSLQLPADEGPDTFRAGQEKSIRPCITEHEKPAPVENARIRLPDLVDRLARYFGRFCDQMASVGMFGKPNRIYGLFRLQLSRRFSGIATLCSPTQEKCRQKQFL